MEIVSRVTALPWVKRFPRKTLHGKTPREIAAITKVIQIQGNSNSKTSVKTILIYTRMRTQSVKVSAEN